MKKKLFAIMLCLAMMISLAASLSEVSFAEEEKTFTVTKRLVGSTEDGELVGNYDTLYDAYGACMQNNQSNEYVITVNKDYDIPADEHVWSRQHVNIVLKSAEGKKFTLKRLGTRLIFHVDKDCKMRVENVILDGNKDGELTFISENGELTLGKGTVVQNFIDVPSADGPAIFLQKGTLNILPGAVIQNNNSNTSGGVIEARNGTTVNISGGTFKNNTSSTSDGGFLAAYGTLNITGGTFDGNTAKKTGGAVIVGSRATATISNATFKNNKASTGGAVYSLNSISISKTTFENNEAVWGGAIFASKGVDLNNVSFTENIANKQGGAIYISKGDSVLTDCIFTKNGSQAIFINHENNGTTTISKTSFTENYSNSFGGGIYLGKNSKLDISNSTFTKNEAAYGAGIASAGTGDVDTSLTNIKLDSCTFTDNLSLMGAGIFTAFPTEINNCTFTKNKADVHPQDDQTNPHDSGVGGAIEVMDNKTTIKASTFEENWAFGSGGALGINGVARDEDKDITIIKPNIKVEISDNTKFIGNTCKVGQGGAIFTIPYLYDIEGYETGVDKDTLKAEAYKNLSTSADTIFKDNLAISGFVDPPANYTKYTNLAFARNSFTDVLPSEDVAKSLLNNYDVNYKKDKLSAFFDPNGGEFTNGENPKDIRVVNGEANKEITLLEAPKWEGHKFIGWKCSMNISKDLLSKLPKEYLDELKKLKEGKIYQAGDKFTLDADYIFVAQWDKADTPAPRPSTTVILTLDENHRGGEITNIEVEEGDLIEPHLYIPRRRGYIFKGWSYDRKHLDEVKPGDRIYSDTTLYAIWKRAEEEKVEEPEEIKGEDHKAYIFGYPNGTVRPNGSITRAEAAAMLARLLNIEAIGSAAKPQFTDTESSWYNKAINAVVFRGIMKGYPDGRFRPNAPITRAEFTQMISTIDNKPYGVAPFADVPGHWAERAIGSEYQAKRITGYPDGLFRPDANITRAEAAVILNKIFERKYDNLSLLKCKNPQMIKRFTDLDESFWGWNDMVEATNTHEYVRRYKEDVLKRVEEDWLLIK